MLRANCIVYWETVCCELIKTAYLQWAINGGAWNRTHLNLPKSMVLRSLVKTL